MINGGMTACAHRQADLGWSHVAGPELIYAEKPSLLIEETAPRSVDQIAMMEAIDNINQRCAKGRENVAGT